MMHHVAAGPLVYEFSRHLSPRARVRPGDRLTIEAEDAFSGQIRSDADRRDKGKMPFSNPLTGPIFIEGAEPGDTLLVHIESLQPVLAQCATRTSDPKQLCEWLGDDCPHGTHVCPIEGGRIRWSEDVSIPYQPMLGCIGTAPAWGIPTTIPAGPHGGNLDLIEVGPGSTVHLPVYVAGGYLYLGDAHAAMGHGELSASGLEMTSLSTIRVDLRKQHPLPAPRIESDLEIAAVATGCPMERSVAQAYAWLIQWMEADFGWNRWRAYDLLTHVGRLSIGYFALGTVAAKVEKKYLGAQLATRPTGNGGQPVPTT
jgi:acetamidase/formamidase